MSSSPTNGMLTRGLSRHHCTSRTGYCQYDPQPQVLCLSLSKHGREATQIDECGEDITEEKICGEERDVIVCNEAPDNPVCSVSSRSDSENARRDESGGESYRIQQCQLV
jgi:hypothetical protein